MGCKEIPPVFDGKTFSNGELLMESSVFFHWSGNVPSCSIPQLVAISREKQG